jgi:hypothetical protein
MPQRVYFDTVAFRHIGQAFEKEGLSPDLRERNIISPITIVEVLSQLTIKSAEEVLRQIQAIHNWTNPTHTELLAWPNDTLFSIWFGKAASDSGLTKRMEKAINVCLASDSVESLQEDAGKAKDAIDEMKQQSTQDFRTLLAAARKEPFDGEKFSEAWFRGIANRVKADPASKRMSEIILELSAYHEFEHGKLQAAVQNKDYNPEKHANDLLDAEQLIYLQDKSLCFLTCDTGFQNLVKKSPQVSRIIIVSGEDLASASMVEALLRKITQPTSTSKPV